VWRSAMTGVLLTILGLCLLFAVSVR